MRYAFVLLGICLLSVSALAQEATPLLQFLQLAVDGDLDGVSQRLTDGVDVHATDENGLTALHHAASNNQSDVCALLLKHGAEVNQKARDGQTALISAAFKGAVESATILLDGGANVDSMLNGKMTALSIALRRRHVDVALLLVERGADVRLKNAQNIGPMDVVFERRIDTLFFPLFDAMTIESEEREEALTEFLEIAVTIDFLKLYKQILGHSPEMKVKTDPFFKAIECGSRSILEYLIGKGRSLDETVAGSQWTALHFFAQSNNTELVDFALDSGLSVDATDVRGWTPLHVAAYLGQIEAAGILLEEGAPVDAQDETKSTPLHLAASRGKTKMVRLLMSAGGSPGSVDIEQHTPLDVALLSGHAYFQNVFPFGTATIDLENYGFSGDLKSVWVALLAGESETVKRLLAVTGSDVDMVDEYGATLLHYAAQLGDVDSIGHLLTGNADPNIVNEVTSWTPLLHASNGGYTNVAKLLMMGGANVNVQDVRGWTALHVASFHGNEELVDGLIVAGADEMLRNKNGEAPADIAGNLARFVEEQALRVGAL